jgi:hypothetical protein
MQSKNFKILGHFMMVGKNRKLDYGYYRTAFSYQDTVFGIVTGLL